MVYILLGTGFEEIEAAAPCDILRRGGVEVALVGVDGARVKGGHGIEITADVTLDGVDESSAEMIVVPGGLGGVETIEASEKARALIKRLYDAGVETAAICAGPRVLGGLGILRGAAAVCYPGMEEQMNCPNMRTNEKTVRHGYVTTGRGPGTALDFGFALLEALRGKAAADAVAQGMCYER